MSASITVTQAREKAAAKLQRELRSWAIDGRAAASAALNMPLHPPTERSALADQTAARAWARAWDDVEGVVWTSRAWPSIGKQLVPERLLLQGAGAIADFAGAASARRWKLACGIVEQVRDALSVPGTTALVSLSTAPPTASVVSTLERLNVALYRHLLTLMGVEPAERARVLELSAWIANHDVSGMFLREIPLPGVDSKWLEGHRSVVLALVSARTGEADLGLRVAEDRVRIRFLDPSVGSPGARDLELPVSQAAELDLAPRRVVVVENLQTFLALPSLPGALAIFGSGYGAGTRLERLSWLRAADILYWGDMDSHGLAVLNQFRSRFPQARSVLMDTDALFEHHEQWVQEGQPFRGVLPQLTDGEQQLLDQLRAHGDVRLEQERLSWDFALDRLRNAV